MDQNHLVKVVNLMKNLKEKLTCSICLEIIRDVCELQCGHKFCNECFTQYKSSQKNICCPLCKTTISRRSSIYRDEYSDHLGKFVYKLCDYLNTVSSTHEGQVLQKNIKSIDNNKAHKFPKNMPNSAPSSSKGKKKKDSCLNKSSDKSINVHYNSLLLNKSGSKRTYVKKKKQTKIPEPKYEILDFDNSETKATVLQWLTDTRNNFDRLSQTQQVSKEVEDKNVMFGLPSISQLKPPQEFNTHEFSRAIRSKSVEIETRKPEVPRRRTYSELSKSDNYHIEEANTEEEKVIRKSEENVLLGIIEDEFLNNLEETSSKVKKCRQKSASKPVNESINNSLSGWDRITEIKKSLQTSKLPKKLKVVVNSSQCSTKSNKNKKQKENLSLTANTNEEIKNTSKKLKREGTLHISDFEENNKIEEGLKPKTTYDLDALESYIAQNIVKENCKEKNSNLSKSYLHQDKDNTEALEQENEYDPYLVPTQKINLEGGKKDVSKDNEDGLYIIPTQKLNTDDGLKENDIESILENCDKVCDNSNVSIDRELVQAESTVHLIGLLEECLQKCHKTSKDVIVLEKHLLNMNKVVKKIKYVNEDHGQSIDKCDISTQTEDNVLAESCKTKCNVSTQMEVNAVDKSVQVFQSYNNKITQTMQLESISSSTQVEISIQETASQANLSPLCTIKCKECAKDVTEAITPNTKADLESIINEPNIFSLKSNNVATRIKDTKTQNEMLTCTLDNINFSTQDIIGSNSVQKLSHNSNRRERDDEIKTPDVQKLTNSQLICTIQSNTTDTLKRNRSNDQNPISDSEDEIKPRVKRNRFLNEDLSIEFMTNTEKKLTSSPDSSSINYDECLEEILKKYNNEQPGCSKFIQKKVEEKSENILKQCDDILKKIPINKKVQQNSESTDIISETESMEPVPKKSKLSKLNEAIVLNNIPLSNEAAVISVNKDKDICEELNDSLEDIEFENIELPKDRKKVNVLENIIVATVPQEQKYKNDECDIFSEDDEDIVETTPQKNHTLSDKQSQRSQRIRMELTFPENDENKNSDSDVFVLPPPPGFQDFDMEDSSKADSASNITVIPCTKPVKEEELIEPKKIFREDDPFLPFTTSKVEHSTPFSYIETHHQNLSCISPIPKERENNLIDAIQTSTLSLSTTPKRFASKQNILSSTPKQRSMWNYVRPSQESVNDAKIEKTVKSKPCIACTRLNNSQIMSISQLTNKKLAVYSSTFHKDVTHMIVAVDSNNCLQDYTAKFVAAVAAGIWVLRFDWILDCLNKNTILPEQPYEVFDDVGGTGPKTSRLTRIENPLFRNFKFHCTNEFFSTTKQEIEDIIKMLDGQLVAKPENLACKDGRIGLIITEGRATQDFEIYEHWLELYNVATVDIEWLSKSIGRYSLLSIRPYIWCSDDNLDNLGYPEYLIESVPFSTE